MSFREVIKSPWAVHNVFILLVCLGWMVDWWKNFVFLSTYFSSCTLYFCFHKTSSWELRFVNCWLMKCSLSTRFGVHPLEFVSCWIFFIWMSKFLWAWKIFPKLVLFQCLSLFLKFLSFCWKRYIREPYVWLAPPTIVDNCLATFCQRAIIFQIGRVYSIFGPLYPPIGFMGQWCKPTRGRILESRAALDIMRESLIKNLSNLHAKWLEPEHLLLQVKMPFVGARSMSYKYIMRLEKALMSLSRHWMHVCFSSKEMIMLKFSPRIWILSFNGSFKWCRPCRKVILS